MDERETDCVGVIVYDFRDDLDTESLVDALLDTDILGVKLGVELSEPVLEFDEVGLKSDENVVISEPLSCGEIDCVNVCTGDTDGEGVSEFECVCV